MSSVLRTYARSKPSGRPRKYRGCGCLLPVLASVLLAGAWVSWVTRDAYPPNRFIAADRTYEIYATDFLNKRARLAEARIWSLLPSTLPLAADFAALTQKLEMPSWVLNNVAYSTFHVSGRDIEQFSDPLLITRMTRVGCLLERIQRFSADVVHDRAGGLNLHSVEGGALVYAVRGRILLVSSDRDALIRALTLAPEQCAQATADAEATPAGNVGEAPDLHFRIRPNPETVLGQVFERADIGLFADGAGARLDCRAELGPSQRARLAPLLSRAVPTTLLQPAPGLVTVSANFGSSLPETWGALRSALEDTGRVEPLVAALAQFAGDRRGALERTFGPLLNSAGPRWTLTWHGFDHTAVLPAPQFSTLARCDESAFEAHSASVQPWPTKAHAWPAEGFLFPESHTLLVPMPAGPAFSPAAMHNGEMLALGTSLSTVAEAATTKAGYLDARANLHIAFAPAPLIGALRQAAMELAEARLLRGQTVASVDAWFITWSAVAGGIESVKFTAAHDAPALHAVIDLVLASSGPAEPTE